MIDSPEAIDLLRRDALRIGGLSAFGLGAAALARTPAAHASQPTRAAKAKACILIWLDGGPSHLETFDPKPDAPVEVRGPLGTVATSIPGIRLGECFPQTAKWMNRLAIIRSMTSPLGEHNFGTHYLMTGYKPSPVLEYPSIGSVFTEVKHQTPKTELPANIAVPDFRVGGAAFTGAGFLPSRSLPFSVGSDPAKPNFSVRDLELYPGVNADRLERRRGFADAFHRFDPSKAGGGASQLDSDLRRAYDLIRSTDAKRAFELSDEPSSVRKRYGTKTVGQSCLLAR
ncbi:MAG: DUF1501 domain-containing protein, partial [Planctomycetota bacterium]